MQFTELRWIVCVRRRRLGMFWQIAIFVHMLWTTGSTIVTHASHVVVVQRETYPDGSLHQGVSGCCVKPTPLTDQYIGPS